MEQHQATNSEPQLDPPAPIAAEPSFGAWIAARRTKLEFLLIGGIAIGGIVCMMLIVFVALWISRQP